MRNLMMLCLMLLACLNASAEPLPMPHQTVLMDDFTYAAERAGRHDLVNNPAGQAAGRLNAQELDIAQAPVSAATLAALVGRIADGTISNNAARQVFEALWSGEGSEVDALIEVKGLKQMSDTGALESIVDEVIAANPDNVAQFKAGKDKAFNALVGQAMKATKGKANPQQVNDLLRRKLAG